MASEALQFLPDRGAVPDLPADVDEWLRNVWMPPFTVFLRDLGHERPEDGSEAESAIIDRFVKAVDDAILHAGAATWGRLLNEGIAQNLAVIIQREMEATETLKKLAFRQLQSAAEHVFTFSESLRRSIPSDATPEELGELLQLALDELRRHGVRSETDFARLTRAQLDILVAFAAASGEVKDFAWWSQHAYRVSLTLASFATTLQQGALRGELVRLRARRAWRGWTIEDMRREVEPWNRGAS